MDTKKRAELISTFFQPVIIPVILYLLVSFRYASGSDALLYFLLGVVFITIAPVLLITILTKMKIISDPDIPNRRERFLPYLMIVLLYLVGFFIFFVIHAPGQILSITVSYILVTLVGALISLYWKISMHLAGIAGPITALVFYVSPYFLLAYLLLIPLGWARLTLKKHSLSQIMVGSACSIFLTYLVIRFFA
ncbi:MAG: hypothetical protein NTX88_08080 [Candidatus Atribacteria bacterium]|nr:hypothetical protein [Candidatus Atribacteria bacterium]